MPRSDLLTTTDVAALCGVNVRTVARWVEAGHITPVLQGPGAKGAWFFDPADVDELLAQRTA
jgi:phage terminase Nu1 subunit (DNA packaging protein)